jgi:hypothetical protein
MFGNFVFDIDGAMAIAMTSPDAIAKEEATIRERFGNEYFERHCLTAMNYPHYIFPGYYALFQWLHSLGGKIFYFSSGVEPRNVELAEKMMKIAFGENAAEITGYKVFSRQHCFDTERYSLQESQDLYQSFFYGQKKKKLAGVVVPEAEIENTLLIDDDNSYMLKGEEYNMIVLRYCYQYIKYDSFEKYRIFTDFHRAYYVAGLLAYIFEMREAQNLSLIECAKYMQIDKENAVLSRDFYYPSYKRLEYYTKGLEILQKFDASLKFYSDIPTNFEN